MLCLDVDGTIVDREGCLYPAAERLARTATGLGLGVVLCSARSSAGLRSVVERLPGVVALSCLGGALIRRTHQPCDPTAGCVLHEAATISTDACRSLVAVIARFPGIDLWGFTRDAWWITRPSDRADREAWITSDAPAIVDLDTFLLGRFLKLVLPEVGGEDLAGIVGSPGLDGLSLNYSTGFQVEIMDGRIRDKGIGVLRNELLAAPATAHSARSSLAQAVIAVGDSFNDAGMLSAADYAVTFADAPATIRAAAHLVLPASRPHGLRDLADRLPGIVRRH